MTVVEGVCLFAKKKKGKVEIVTEGKYIKLSPVFPSTATKVK